MLVIVYKRRHVRVSDIWNDQRISGSFWKNLISDKKWIHTAAWFETDTRLRLIKWKMKIKGERKKCFISTFTFECPKVLSNCLNSSNSIYQLNFLLKFLKIWRFSSMKLIVSFNLMSISFLILYSCLSDLSWFIRHYEIAIIVEYTAWYVCKEPFYN